MIDKATHATLEKKWAKLGPGVYQKWNRLETRMPLFLSRINNFKGKNVVEFGCNAGVYGYEISKVATSYIGVDQGDYYIEQATATKKFFGMSNATFMCNRVKQFIRDRQKREARGQSVPPINAIFATFVLYHLSDKETDLIAQHLFPACDTVVIMTRTSKRSAWKKYNSRKLHKIKNVEKYLREYGYECTSEMDSSGKFGITVAKKEIARVNDTGDCERDSKGEDKGTGRLGSSGVGKGRMREGRKVLSVERQADAEGPDGVLSQVQTTVGTESNVQGGQRQVLSGQQKGGDERVSQQKKTGAIRGDTQKPESSEGNAGLEIQGQEDTDMGLGDKD